MMFTKVITLIITLPGFRPIALHLAAVKENYPPAFLSQLDNHLAQNIEKGIPIQVDTQQQTHAQTEMLLGA